MMSRSRKPIIDDVDRPFTPTLAWLERALPKWRWRLVTNYLGGQLDIAVRSAGGGFNPRGPIAVGVRSYTKRSKAKSRILVDKWAKSLVFYTPVGPAVESFTWSADSHAFCRSHLIACTHLHIVARKRVLDRLDEAAEVRRRAAVVAIHEGQHGPITALERLRMRWQT
jgi:hypothetical protein